MNLVRAEKYQNKNIAGACVLGVNKTIISSHRMAERLDCTWAIA